MYKILFTNSDLSSIERNTIQPYFLITTENKGMRILDFGFMILIKRFLTAFGMTTLYGDWVRTMAAAPPLFSPLFTNGESFRMERSGMRNLLQFLVIRENRGQKPYVKKIFNVNL